MKSERLHSEEGKNKKHQEKASKTCQNMKAQSMTKKYLENSLERRETNKAVKAHLCNIMLNWAGSLFERAVQKSRPM